MKRTCARTLWLPRLLMACLVLFSATLMANVVLPGQNQVSAQGATNRVMYEGKYWYLNGANVAWYNWGCDFGCNQSNGKGGGVSTNLGALEPGIQRTASNGMRVLRWWLFPGDPWQIRRDGSGAPASIDPAVYVDIDAALALAEKYDVYYNFVLFSAPTALPRTWLTDAGQRAKLAQVVGTLFARYAGNRRIMAWEAINEPENDIWNNQIAQQPVVDTVKAIIASQRANAPRTLATIGSLFADGMWNVWKDADVDFFSPHWYDYMNQGDYGMILNNADYYRAKGINKPIVVGEYYTEFAGGNPWNSTYRQNHWYNNGYAGAWGWSIFWDRTNDKMQIDYAAVKALYDQHQSDMGPVTGGGIVPTTRTSQVQLSPGWNMVSLPLHCSATAAAQVLQSLAGQYDLVYAYDATNPSSPWKKLNTSAPAALNTLTDITCQIGLWIRATTPSTLRVEGVVQATTSIALRAGWNLVGYPSQTARAVTDALSSIAGKYDLIYTYNSTNPSSPWVKFNPAAPAQLNSLTQLKPGQSYWIRATQACTWTVNGN